MTLGQRLKILRINKVPKVTQEDVAKHIGITRATYSNWEIDRALPDLDSISLLADYYRVSVDYLLGRKPLENINSLDERASNLSKENQQVIEKVLRSLEIEERVKEEKKGTGQGR